MYKQMVMLDRPHDMLHLRSLSSQWPEASHCAVVIKDLRQHCLASKSNDLRLVLDRNAPEQGSGEE